METKEQMLEEIYGDDVEEFNSRTGIARISGERAYILDPSRTLSLRHELVAELAATGMKPAEIARMLKTNPEKTDSGHYARLLRDPRVRALARKDVGDVVDEAKDVLKGAVLKSAQNVAKAVKDGDLKMSTYVLGSQGISEKPQTNNTVNLNFGAWLSSHQDTKQIHNISAEEGQVVTDISELQTLPEGERLC